MGLPVITMPSDFMIGRMAYVFYRQMNYMSLVVHSAAEYAALAMSLAHKPKLRQQHTDAILERVGVLYNCENVTQDWVKFVTETANPAVMSRRS
jgi:predicted O-linked N-acetylglucosamine transferase (SPINDLY family)